jgi:antitoxin component YwqK of YwqJK toxin-antitoxin module
MLNGTITSGKIHQTWVRFTDMKKKTKYLKLLIVIVSTFFACGPNINNVPTHEKNDTVKKYYENGNLKSQEIVSNGKKVGTWKYFDEGGNIENLTNYVDGKEEGPSLHFFDNGKVKLEAHYKGGNLDSVFILYNEDGTINKGLLYKNGVGVKQIYP